MKEPQIVYGVVYVEETQTKSAGEVLADSGGRDQSLLPQPTSIFRTTLRFKQTNKNKSRTRSAVYSKGQCAATASVHALALNGYKQRDGAGQTLNPVRRHTLNAAMGSKIKMSYWCACLYLPVLGNLSL